MLPNQLKELASRLSQAWVCAQEIEPLTKEFPDLTIDDAYQTQELLVQLRCERGDKRVGYKMGLTSKAKMEQMNLNSPIYGILMKNTQVACEERFSLKGTIHPKIEPELAFRISKDVRGVLSMEEARQVCSGVCAALEVVDSRYKGFKYFSLPDVIADNCSASHFILSEQWVSPKQIDLSGLLLSMKVNGKVAHEASSSAVLGNPLNSVIELSRLLVAHGKYLPEGSIVLAGAATQAVALEKSMVVELVVPDLKEVKVFVE